MYNQSFFKKNKYNAVRTKYDGYNYASRLEARQAAELDIMLKAKMIKGWERQYKVEFECLTLDGQKTSLGTHKIDFRVHELDDSYTLIETKGMETEGYMLRRRMLEKVWLPVHLDHTYRVVK